MSVRAAVLSLLMWAWEGRVSSRSTSSRAVVLLLSVVTSVGPALSDEAAEMGMGVVYGELDAARSVCRGLIVDEQALAQQLGKAGVDLEKPSAAFKRGQAEADARASEAIANERLRSFCFDVVKAYGSDGSSLPGLVRPR